MRGKNGLGRLGVVKDKRLHDIVTTSTAGAVFVIIFTNGDNPNFAEGNGVFGNGPTGDFAAGFAPVVMVCPIFVIGDVIFPIS